MKSKIAIFGVGMAGCVGQLVRALRDAEREVVIIDELPTEDFYPEPIDYHIPKLEFEEAKEFHLMERPIQKWQNQGKRRMGKPK